MKSDSEEIFYYTYVLLSPKDGLHYIGFSDNIDQRFKEHCSGLVEATKDRRPLKLAYYEACQSREKAIQREKYFKTGYGRRFLKSRLA